MTPDQQKKFESLQRKLRELFMLDFPELDFGIYRIMNHKRREIEQFLAQDLLPQVRAILAENQNADTDATRRELDNLEKTLQSAGVDPNANAKVLELRRALAHDDPDALAPEVYFHLTTFFSRYYDSGDFISQRRYKNDVYAIPYQGEEVKLHWANHDQYYIKTAEHFKTYRFRLNAERRVTFALADAATDQNNNKSSDKRAFALADEDFLHTDPAGELTLTFTYLPTKTKQAELNKDAFERIRTALADPGLHPWLDLVQPGKAPTAANPQRSLLEKHLTDYTARNTFDYFIHKDLGAFLHRELDFYIKNEVLFLDDVGSRAADEFVRQIAKIKAIKAVGEKIIAFLAQLENFQKKLWLKKKFVTDTHYCITLDRIPTEFYAEIAANTAQTGEWVRLFRIDLIAGGPAPDLLSRPVTAFSRPLSEAFLQENPFLPVDTAFFPEDFKTRLLAQFHDLDEQTDGLLIHSENFQALGLLQERYREEVKCVYIDPPYNTAASEILYKNEYKNSSWLALMDSRLGLGKDLLAENGLHCTTIDDFEYHFLKQLLDQTFLGNYLGTVSIRNNPSGRPTPNSFAIAHEYGIFHSKKDTFQLTKFGRSDELNKRYKEEDEHGIYMWELLRKRGSNSDRSDRPKMYYPFFVKNKALRLPKMQWIEEAKVWEVLEKPEQDEVVVYPIDEEGMERNWRMGVDTIIGELAELRVEKGKNNTITVYYKYRPPSGISPTTSWIDSKYSATEHGTGVLKNLFSDYDPFSFPKSIHAVQDCIYLAGLSDNDLILDYFAGSGTTAHAVLNLNREDGGRRKYILVEMGEYFDAVTRPRVLKAAYSKDWAGGAPVSRAGMSHCLKYLRLESYEDALNNLLPAAPEAGLWQGAPAAREQYLLHYLLDFETRGQHLDLERFRKPFDYRLRITRAYETREQAIDLVETFNYLIGLRVAHRWQPRPGLCLLRGHTRAGGERTLVVWRDCDQWDNAALNAFLEKSDINPRDGEFDRIYVNGDNNVENLKTGDERWKVALTEEEFLRRMFEGA